MSLKSWAIKKWADNSLLEMNRLLSRQLDEQHQLIRAAAERWYPKQQEWKEETTRLKEQAKELKKEVAKYRLRCLLQRSEVNMEPLTMQQLMDMNGCFVWVDAPKQSDWALARACKDKDDVILWNVDGGCWSFKAAGDSIKVYERKVQHIDRAAWEPCGEMCRNNCATCDHNADELFGDADYCKDCHRYSKWESSIHKYCERCGRPRTPEAWAELEKRLGVIV